MGSGGSKKSAAVKTVVRVVTQPTSKQTAQQKEQNMQSENTNQSTNKPATNAAEKKQETQGDTKDTPAISSTTEKKTEKQKNTNSASQSNSEQKPSPLKALDNRPKTASQAQAQQKPPDHWTDAKLADLMHGLELSDDSKVWSNYCDSLITRYDPRVQPEKERKGWKTVRLFVSSTFKDMDNERDYLVKKIFPQLREWCEPRKLRLIECDLRWGVPKDADTRETLMACLSEIDRCREENEYPYLLNLTSERYGWVPKIDEVPDDIRAKYKWMPGMSVTTSEIMVGGYWDRNKHALYMLRTPEYLEHIKDEKIKSYFVEKEEGNRESLAKLKDKLRAHYPDQVFSYSCRYEGEEGGRLRLAGLEEMGERVLTHFKAMLEQQYPTDSLGQEPSLQEELRMEHEIFMFQRSQVLLGRDESVKKISDYIAAENVPDQMPLVLVGFPGSGKSALMSYGVKQAVQNSSYKVFYHFIGATPGSTDLFQILSRFFLEFMPEGTKMPEDVQEMKRYADTMFKYAAEEALKQGYSKLVVFLDALNQMDDDGDAQYLFWLPKPLPKGMKVVVSTLEGKSLNALRGNEEGPANNKRPASQELSVDPLDKDVRKDIVESVLAEFNKKLDEEQMEILVSKPDAGKPLWLTVACEELRVFGQFRKLTQKIKDLPEEMTGLLEMVLQRIVSEYGGDLIVATLCLVETSRFGLLETELLELLAIQPTVQGAKTNDDLAVDGKLPMAKWALAYVGLRRFLRPCGSSGEGRLDFHHRTISKAVRKLYLQDKANQIWWHNRLAQYFETCKDIDRKAEELPYHIEKSEDKEKLKTTLLSQDMFDAMYQESNKQELMKYWRFCGGYNVASQAYVQSMNQYLKNNNITDIDRAAPIQTKLAWFLGDIGEYDTAIDLLKKTITMLSTQHGKIAKQLADPTHCMAFVLYRKALQYVYGAHPGYKECCSLGRIYAQQCGEIHAKFYASDKRLFGRVYSLCGYFCGKDYLEKAKEVLTSINDQQGLGEVLYMLGEKNQYNEDLSIPIALFEKSMKLCLSMYGNHHFHTARCCQLFGQMYWNNWVYNKRRDWLESCLGLYVQEVEILEEIQGETHPNTVRSREDVIIILQNLGRNDEANKHKLKQPKEHAAL